MPDDIAHSPRITIAEALARLELAVGRLETAAAVTRQERSPTTPTPETGQLETARAEIEALRGLHAAVSEKLEKAIVQLRAMVAEER